MFPPGTYVPDDVPPTIGDGTLDIDPLALQKLKVALAKAAEILEDGTFRDLDLAEAAFGARPSATELGAEHRTAHAIIADTISGVIADLWGYRTGVEDFEKGMGGADETAAADLSTETAAVDALAASSSLDDGADRYQNSQRDHLPAGSETTQSAAGPDAGAGPESEDG